MKESLGVQSKKNLISFLDGYFSRFWFINQAFCNTRYRSLQDNWSYNRLKCSLLSQLSLSFKSIKNWHLYIVHTIRSTGKLKFKVTCTHGS